MDQKESSDQNSLPKKGANVAIDPSRMIGIIKRKALIKDLAAAYHAECLACCRELLELQKKWEELFFSRWEAQNLNHHHFVKDYLSGSIVSYLLLLARNCVRSIRCLILIFTEHKTAEDMKNSKTARAHKRPRKLR